MEEKAKKYLVVPLGCATNKVDAERLAGIFEEQGYEKTDSEEEADVFAIVACSIRQSAVDRIYGRIHNWEKLKEIKPREFILTGCVLDRDLKKFDKIFDKIMTIEELYEDMSLKTKRFSKFQAGVPIMRGCNNFCTYCAVPYTRGREKSRPFDEVVKEVKDLVGQGYKEITLLGQNVNSYENNFAKLMATIAELEDDFWLRFASPHPRDFGDDLIEVMAKYPKIAKQINLPVQAGSDKILKKMNRPYTIRQFKKLVKKIYKAMPDISISTDIIVGFSGETKWDFKKTLKLFKKIKFDMGYLAEYSERKGTAASKAFEDDVSKDEKDRRKKELNKILIKNSLEYNQRYLDQTIKVLVEKKRKDHWLGRNEEMKSIEFIGGENLEGQFVNVKINKVEAWSLKGSLN